jgi:hypothetical protein
MTADKKLWRNRKERKQWARRLQSEDPGGNPPHMRRESMWAIAPITSRYDRSGTRNEKPQLLKESGPKYQLGPALARYPRRQIQIRAEISERGGAREAVWDLSHNRGTSRPRTERSRPGTTNCRLGDVCANANDGQECSAVRPVDSGPGRNRDLRTDL